MSEPILEMKNISKNFGSVIALKNVDLEVYPGEIRGLIGENGSGKSTISSIAAGMQKATSGRMTFKKQNWEPASMIDALQNGIGMVVQESGTISGVTVAENIFLAELSQFRNKLGMINKKAMNQKATEAMQAIGVEHVTGDMPIASLDFQTRKLVEIAKVMLKNPDILVIDETSTALSQDGREIMYSLIRKLRDSGKAVIFISHDLEEIMEVCDTLTVLRDGNLIRTFKKEEFNADEIRTSMIGRELQGDYYRSDFTPSSQKEAAITATNLKYKEALKSVSITLKKGEILGIGGLASCGMHTLGKAMYGAFIPNPMHVYRVAGVLNGLGCTYGGESDMDAIAGQIFQDQTVDLSKVEGDVEVVSYLQGYGDTTTDELNAAIQKTPDAFISVGMATTFFAQSLSEAGISFSDIDSFTETNGNSMKNGTLTYLAGKYSSSIGPVFALVMNAINGNVIRDEDGNAPSISQGYLVATDSDTFDKYSVSDSGDAPIYDKETLDTIIGDSVTFEDVKTLVESK